MSYVPKPNTGTLWPNEYKRDDRHPDMRGDLALDRTFLQDMIDKSEGDLIKLQISAWSKAINGKSCFSMSASAPYVKPETKPAPKPPPPADDEEIPF